MTELEAIQARFEELNELLRVNPDMEHWEAMLIIEGMRMCVDQKNALKEAEYIACENARQQARQRSILTEEITQALIEFFGEEISDEDLETLAEKLTNVYATSGEGYERWQ